MAASTKKKVAPKGVSKKEFESFQQETRDGISTILDALDKFAPGNATPPVTVASPSDVAPQVSVKVEVTDEEAAEAESAEAMAYLPPQYARIFQRYFDEDDGFTARLSFPTVDEKGREDGGITFTIVVPDKFSNVSEAHKSLYKVDLRTRALQPHNLAKGIEDWCAKVAKNLKYDKNIKTK